MQADQAQPIVRRDLHGHIEYSTAHPVPAAIQLQGHIGLGIAGDDGEFAEQREVAITSLLSPHPLEIGKIHPGLAKPSLKVSEHFLIAHFGHTQNVGHDRFDGRNQGADFLVGFR